ncbi:hypothetical protein PFICI_07170 [Pestalotiopsis fici W106-1]|uniref:Centromere protein Scm3 n=1 Tax=Pestalotiopsis fici (strain W106-1 / CGMCC3.15140) TaxID=1229662 RepID=W3X7R8_PESFW|nr:uncharacterized protein PFICI_07170 [Pestalotiopsis fici W106-1]ETS82168.1 hypothetical protein PFICI_07170 [Pestalotiopsis fici W106-1]
MDFPAKRARTARRSLWDEDDDAEANDDELTLSASQFDARQHPMYQLEKKRAKSAFKLKSRFEDIFEKYSKDFDGVGDEIDLRTGEVVVNNGHLQSLEDEDLNKSEDEEEDEEEALGVKRKDKIEHSDENRPSRLVSHSRNGSFLPGGAWLHADAPPSMFDSHSPLFPGNGASDPAWQIPELQLPPRQNIHGSGSPFDQSYQSSFGAASFGMGFGAWGTLGQPYRRFTAAKDIGPRAEVDSDVLEHISGAVTDDSGEEDALCSEIANPSVSIPRSRTMKRFEAVTAPFAGLNEAVQDRESAEESQPTRRPVGRPRKKLEQGSHNTMPAETLSPKLLPTSLPSDAANNTVLPLRPISMPNTSAIAEVCAGEQALLIDDSSLLIDDSSDSQGRRSARVRKPIEHYSQINWTRTGDQASQILTPPPDENTRQTLPQSSPLRPNDQPTERLAVEFSSSSQNRRPEVIEDDEEYTRNSSPANIGADDPKPSKATQNLEESGLSIIENETDGAQLSNSVFDVSKDMLEKSVERSGLLLDADGRGTNTAGTTLETLPFVEEDVEGDTEESVSKSAQLPQHDEVVLDSDNTPDNLQPHTYYPEPNEECGESHHGDESIELGEPIVCDSDPLRNINGDTEDIDAARQLHTEALEATATYSDLGGEDMSSPSRSLATEPVSPPFKFVDDPGTNPSPELLQQSLGHSPHHDSPAKRNRKPDSEAPFTQSPTRPGRRPAKRTSPSKLQPSTPKKTRTLASLIPNSSDDDDEDELSILSSSVPTTPTSNSLLRVSFVRGASQISSDTPAALQSRQNSALFSTPRHSTHGSTRIESRQGSPVLPRMPATDTTAVRFGLKRKRPATTTSLAQSSPLARTVLLRTPQKDTARKSSRSIQTSSPMDDRDRTTGGTARRCGEDGFACHRDFCFTCCQ